MRPPDTSPTAAEVIDVPDRVVGAVIGTGGATITEIKRLSGAHVQVDVEKTDPRKVIVTGSATAVAQAVQMIRDVVASPLNQLSSRFGGWGGADRVEPVVMEVPHKQAGIIIGRGGESIREITQLSGAHVQISTGHASDSEARSIVITGNSGQVEAARRLIHVKLHPGEAAVWEPESLLSDSRNSTGAGCLPDMYSCTAATDPAAADPAAAASAYGADAHLQHYGHAYHLQQQHMQHEAMQAHLAARFTAQAQHTLLMMVAAAAPGDFGPAADPNAAALDAGRTGVADAADLCPVAGGGGRGGSGGSGGCGGSEGALKTELSLSVAGMAALLADGPIAQLQSSGVEMHLARRPSGDGRHRVRLRGAPAVVETVRTMLDSIEACSKLSKWRQDRLPPEAEHHRYYARHYEAARLPYCPPRPLWSEEDTEASWYDSWTRYWASAADLGLMPDLQGGRQAAAGSAGELSGGSVPDGHEGQAVQHAAPEDGTAAAPLPEGWQTATTAGGIAYFYNTSTGATQWHRPPG